MPRSLASLGGGTTRARAGYTIGWPTLADGKCFPLQSCAVEDSGAAGTEFAEQVAALQAATRVLAGVALRSLDVLDGVITLPQFRMLAVLAGLGRARSARVARALSLDASTVTRLADRLVTAGYVARGSDPRHRSVVTLELTPGGERLVGAVSQWRHGELSRIVAALPPATRAQLTSVLGQLVAAAGEGYGIAAEPISPVAGALPPRSFGPVRPG
jgi:DNA-binding MarR family transcriptional regulator